MSISVPVLGTIEKLGGGILGLIDQVIEDKDLKQKLAIRHIELLNSLIEKLLETKTIPWVDALVKLMVAAIQLGRPIGSFILTCIGLYLHYNGTPIDGPTQYVIDGAFPAWMTARQYDKGQKEKTKREAIKNGWIETYD